MRLLCNVDPSIVLVADFNCPNIDWSNWRFAVDNVRCSTLLTMFVEQYCFYHLVAEHTWLWPSRNDTLIDLILCNDPFIECDVAVCDPFNVSDHCSIKFKEFYKCNLPVYHHMSLGILILQIGIILQVILTLVIGQLFFLWVFHCHRMCWCLLRRI